MPLSLVREARVTTGEVLIQRRMRALVQAAQRGAPLPSPAVRADGLVLAPSGTAPHPLEHLARSWLHPGR
jgi:hypothetical protein